MHTSLDLTKLFTIGGGTGDNTLYSDTQFLDMSGSQLSCVQPDDYPYPVGEAVGFNLNGTAMICGGKGNTQRTYGPVL